ncbi:MAG TPA: dephospho-CoA kinase, partial [Gammaproteobacteria bacterium]|nr:dephospho-CoA kinase [Gammaproteobacteria bacterium]
MLVGLTGGIGSGKTAAGDRFASLGINVVDADLASRAVVEPGLPALAAITDHFGDTVLTPEGRLDRPVLRQRVFADGDERRWLQNLLHPLIQDYLREQIDASTSPYCLLV